MKLKELTLINFRRFKELNINFHPDVTVIAAKNGQGKTSILDAATVVLGTFVGAFDLGKAKHLEVNDARYHRHEGMAENEQIFPVRLEAELSNLKGRTVRELTGNKNKTTIKDAAELTVYGKKLMEKVRSLDSVELPVMAYYGSGRLWKEHYNVTRKSVLSESRTMGYEDCFTSASSFTQVQQWMSKATFAALQQKNMDAYSDYNLQDQITGIQDAVNTVLRNEGWGNFHYSLQHEELAMTHDELGVLPVSMLSDGVRAMVSLVADLAWRCAKLNPQLGVKAQKKTEGISFIDEVDMHLHPKWQQTVVASLRDAFPKIQFILTTHSPQVLSTVRRESIRLISVGPDSSASAMPLASSYGEESQNVLQAIMGVDPQPPVPEKEDIDRLTVLIESGKYQSEEAQKLLQSLRGHLSENHPQLQRLERSIRRQEALRK
jgi:predicted ATP-binding protein involved in virulence|tara:strand:+ start:511 stop:1812 length:1302 start_codon:yes stop_codon:yes gene_type:complete